MLRASTPVAFYHSFIVMMGSQRQHFGLCVLQSETLWGGFSLQSAPSLQIELRELENRDGVSMLLVVSAGTARLVAHSAGLCCPLEARRGKATPTEGKDEAAPNAPPRPLSSLQIVAATLSVPSGDTKYRFGRGVPTPHFCLPRKSPTVQYGDRV